MDVPGWFPDELAHAGREHRDPAYVAGYDRKAAMDPAEDVALLRELGLDGAATLVDLGTGTGTLAVAAAPFCRRVVAVDPSAAMLEALAAKVERLGLGNVEPVQSGFLTYAHGGAPADVVYSRNALHHLPDFWKALALRRIVGFLRPGGILLLRDLVVAVEPGEAESTVEARLASAVARSEDGWTRAEFEKDLREEHITFSWLLEPLLERAGFEIRAVDTRAGFYAAYTCVRRD